MKVSEVIKIIEDDACDPVYSQNRYQKIGEMQLPKTGLRLERTGEQREEIEVDDCTFDRMAHLNLAMRFHYRAHYNFMTGLAIKRGCGQHAVTCSDLCRALGLEGLELFAYDKLVC